jgi:hypothetical protein
MNPTKCLAFVILLIFTIPLHANNNDINSLKYVRGKVGFYYVNSDYFEVRNSKGKIIRKPPLLRKGSEFRVFVAHEGEFGGQYGTWGIMNDSYKFYLDPKEDPISGVVLKLDEHVQLKDKFYVIGTLPQELAEKLSKLDVKSGDTVVCLEIMTPKNVNITKVRGKYLDRYDFDSIPSAYLKPMKVQLDYSTFKEFEHQSKSYYSEVYQNFFERYYKNVSAILFILCILFFGKKIRLRYNDNSISLNEEPFWDFKRVNGAVIDKQVLHKVETTTSYSHSYEVGNTVIHSAPTIDVKIKQHSEIYVRIDENNVELIEENKNIPVYYGANISIIKMIAVKSKLSQNACFFVHELNQLYFCSKFNLGKFLKWKLPFQFDLLKAIVTFIISYLITMVIVSLFVKTNFSVIANWPNGLEAFSLLFTTILWYSIRCYLIIKLIERTIMYYYSKYSIQKWINKEANQLQQPVLK